MRAEVFAAHDSAVAAALGWFEEHGAVTRRGNDGVDQVDSLGVAAALFRQHTSRSMDPQLHTHAVISSKVQDETGKWLALDSRFLKYQQRTIGWIYDAALRTELTSRLGVGWQRADDGGPVDLDCIPEQVRTMFSKRTIEVDCKLAVLHERWQDEHDGADPDARTIAALERKAVLASRPDKTHGVDATEVHQLWTSDAAAIRFDCDELTADGIRRHDPAPDTSDEAVFEEAIRLASDESSTWLEADLARHIATLLRQPPPGRVGRSCRPSTSSPAPQPSGASTSRRCSAPRSAARTDARSMSTSPTTGSPPTTSSSRSRTSRTGPGPASTQRKSTATTRNGQRRPPSPATTISW